MADRIKTISHQLSPNKINGLRSMSSSVLIEHKGSLPVITLNRPDKLNSLNLEMVRELVPFYDELTKRKDVKYLLMKGSGAKAFCAGGDVAAIQKEIVDGKSEAKDSLAKRFFYEEYQLNHKISKLTESTGIKQISIWRGIVMGGGVGLSVHGAIRVATEKSLFAMPETGIGFFPDVGGTYALSRVSPNKATGMYIGLCGKRLNKDDLLYSKLATHFVPEEKLTELEERLAKGEDFEAICADVTKGVPTFDESKSILKPNEKWISQCFSKNSLEEVLAVLNKLSKEGNEFASKTLKELSRMSPTSLKVSFEAINRNSGSNVSFAQALQTEYRLSQKFMRPAGSDFVEGIRAVLVDKDQKPVWNPSTLEAVTAQEVESFFAPLQKQEELRL